MKKKKNYSFLFILILFLVLTLVLTRGFTYARYASNAVFNYYLSSKGFYFESDDLTYDTKKHVDTMWDGGKVYFSLSNSANEALSSETDIIYEVSCIVDEEDTTKKCLLNGNDTGVLKATLSAIWGCSDASYSDEKTCKNNGKDWVAMPANTELFFEVIDENGDDVLNANVVVTATSTKPYKKELSAVYSLIRDNSAIGGLSMKYEEGNIKSRLIITNSYNENKCISVSWDSLDFAFDNNSNEVLGYTADNDGNINEVYFNINKMDSVTLDFFEKNSSVTYNELYFELVESNLCE